MPTPTTLASTPSDKIGLAPANMGNDRSDASGGTTSVPTPMPLEARPEAKPRRSTNQRCTAPIAGT